MDKLSGWSALKGGATRRRRWPALKLHGLRSAMALALLAGHANAPAQTPAPRVQHLRIVGGLAGLNQYTRHEEPFWTRDLARLSGGHLTAEIVPFDRAGIRGQEMLRLMNLGVVPFGTALLGLAGTEVPEVSAPDLAGLSPDMASLKRVVGAFRPHLERTLKKRYGIEVLAVYAYPAQVVFCNQPFSGLAGLADRRVRVSSPTQADWVQALGGKPVLAGFADIMAQMRGGNLDCAITGTMSGNTIGLHTVTSHVHTMAVSWGLAVFGANGATWQALVPEQQALLRREVQRLERNIWAESERETGEGLACNTSAPGCKGGSLGHMTQVQTSAADEQRRREILVQTVLPRWIQRCGPPCAEVWNQTIGPAVGIDAKVSR